MKKKGNFRKVVSGLLAGMTMLSTVLSPMTAYAAEIQPEKKPPLYEDVKDLLDEDEVVTAKDYEIETGSVFDVKSDYTGLEIKDDNKVKVTFEEAKNEKNEDFTTDHADTYKAVYYVEPVNQEHPKYQISRKLIVREKATEAQTEVAGSEAVTESEKAVSEQQTEEAEDSEADSEVTDIDADEFDDLVEQAQNQDTYDEESGLELHDVLEQAGDEGVDLDSMEEGEIATFEAVSAYSARSTQGLGGFSNVYECADEIITSIRNHRIEELDCIYGISLGASIAIEIALRDCIRINKLILDGGQFESMGIMKKIDAYFMAKEFQKVIQKKRMWSYVSKQMGYRNGNEIEVLYPLCCKRIQFDTLYDAALAAYGYDIKKRMEKLRMKVVIMYGGNELFAAKSVSLVKEKCVSECEVYAYDNMGHSEVLSLHPEKLCEIIRK